MTATQLDCREVLSQLASPFKENDLEWRVQTVTNNNGKMKALVLPYIDSRAVMNRLDQVVGPLWTTEYKTITTNGQEGFQCILSLKIDGEWISRTDAADATDIESVKGGHSNALKRAAVQWGIGRYLYDLPTFWVDVKDRGQHYINGKFKVNGTQQFVKGYFDTPSINGNQKNQNSSNQGTSNNNQSQQPSQQPSQNRNTKPSSQPNNTQPSNNEPQTQHVSPIDMIKGMLNNMNVPLMYVEGLLKRSGAKATKLEETNVVEQRALYNALLPVNTLVVQCRKIGASDRLMLDMAQIVLKLEIKEISSLFFKITDLKMAGEVFELVKSESTVKAS